MTGRCTNSLLAHLAACALLLFSPCSQASIVSEINPPPTTAIEIAQHQINIASGLSQNGQSERAAIEFDRAIQSPAFAQLSEVYQHFAWFEAGNVALDMKKMELAQDLLKRASQSSQAGSQDWHNRLYASFALHDYIDSADCITTIARRWPETLDQINSPAIYAINRELPDEPGQTTILFDFLESLFDANWTARGAQPNGFWVDLTRLLLERDQLDKAIRAAKRIDSPLMVLALRVDKRFDPVTRGRLAEFDLDQVAIASVAQAEKAVTAQPDLLRPILVLHARLMKSRQYARALEVCDGVIARVANGKGADLYKDFDKEYIWILNSRSEALQGLGRMDDAVAALRTAIDLPQGDSENVNQALNLGNLLASLNRPQEALEAVAKLGEMSAFGRMQLEKLQHLVAIENADAVEAKKHLDYMREHRTDALSTFQDALLDAGLLDEATRFVIERLQKESSRTDALLSVQDYAPVVRAPRIAMRHARLQEILARPAILAEVDKVGRIEHVNLDSQ